MLDTRASAAILMLLLGACAPPQQPDLVRLYAPVAATPKAHPLIVIPGVMGSRLTAIACCLPGIGARGWWRPPTNWMT